MVNYDLIAQSYDIMMGDRSGVASFIQDLIDKHCNNPKYVLELACGTGAVLEYFQDKYKLFGLDTSSEMLKIAKKRIPKGIFTQQDMSQFKLDQKFDVIFCIFDSINHLLDFRQRKSLFKSANKHLNEKGVLIFDMNTQAKLEQVANSGPGVRSQDQYTMIMDVCKSKKNIYDRTVKVFKHQQGNTYTLTEEHIQEAAFPIGKLTTELEKQYKVDIVYPKYLNTKKRSGRPFFICMKKPTTE